jgi:hypothetical protein
MFTIAIAMSHIFQLQGAHRETVEIVAASGAGAAIIGFTGYADFFYGRIYFVKERCQCSDTVCVHKIILLRPNSRSFPPEEESGVI